MNTAKISLLLLLAVVSCHAAPTPAECEALTKRMKTKDLSKIAGDWVLMWSVADHDEGHSLLMDVSSSHIEFLFSQDNQEIMYYERNVYKSNLTSCTTYFINITVPSDTEAEHHTLDISSIRVEKDGEPVPYNDTGRIDVYENCPDCLIMVYKTTNGRFLLSYKREGSHRDVEKHKTTHEDHQKMAECLGFPYDRNYTYDGTADFCHKKSAPDA